MKLEDQCCSLDLAKRLKELGVRQESAFWWSRRQPDWKYILCYEGPGIWTTADPEPHFSAFTCSELGEMLPIQVNGFPIEMTKSKDLFEIRYYEEDYGGIETRFEGGNAKTEADARAKMLIFLIEQGIVKTDVKP